MARASGGRKRGSRCSSANFPTGKNTWIAPPKFVHAWVTADNVNSLVRDQASLGISICYRFLTWTAMITGSLNSLLNYIQAKVVVLEFNPYCGPDRSMTISYDSRFSSGPLGQAGIGATSLPAFRLLNSDNARATASSVFSRLIQCILRSPGSWRATRCQLGRRVNASSATSVCRRGAKRGLTPWSPVIRHGKRCSGRRTHQSRYLKAASMPNSFMMVHNSCFGLIPSERMNA